LRIETRSREALGREFAPPAMPSMRILLLYCFSMI
jgi:hypothetical protein